MMSAISLGVFCRSAPSTSLIMRSRKVEPGAAVTRTRIQSDSTCVPPVTAERSPPASRITGADSPVMAASLTEATPSITSPSEGMMSPASTSTMSPSLRPIAGDERVVARLRRGEQLGLGLRARAPERVGLGLAAPLGHGLGEVGEQHGEPQPQHDLEGEGEVLAAGDEVAHEQHRGEQRDDLQHEDDGVLRQRARIELGKSRADRRHDDLGVEQRRDRHAPVQRGGIPWEGSVTFRSGSDPSRMRSCSSRPLEARGLTPLVRTPCPRASPDARRWVRARAPGRR